MGRGTETSSSLLYGKPVRRAPGWEERLEGLDRELERDSLDSATALLRTWIPIPRSPQRAKVAALIARTIASRRWGGMKAGEKGRKSEISYLEERVRLKVGAMLDDGQIDLEDIPSLDDQQRWLLECPRLPGPAGRELIDDSPTLQGSISALPWPLSKAIGDDPYLLLRPLFEKPMAQAVGLLEDRIRHALAWCGELDQNLSPDFFIGRSGSRTVHYEERGRPGMTPCGLATADLRQAPRGVWRSPDAFRIPYRHCKTCERSGAAPLDRVFEELEMLEDEQRQDLRIAIATCIGAVLPDAADEHIGTDLLVVVREVIEDNLDAYALDFLIDHFEQLTSQEREELVMRKLARMGPASEAVVVEDLDAEAKRRFLSLSLDPICKYEFPLRPMIEETMRCGAIRPSHADDFHRLARAFKVRPPQA